MITITNKIIHGDALIELKQLADNSVDSIVCDPPYELGFMSKSWDASGIAYNVDLWRECLRVLKPGGHLLSFGGTRTYHRMACAIEDAGFEVRDMIEWVYGSGFPKSLNIGKAVDKIAGEAGRKEKFTEWMRTTGMKASEANKILQDAGLISPNGTMAGHFFAKDKDGQPAIPTSAIWNILRAHIKTEIPKWVDELVERIEREREVVGQTKHGDPCNWYSNMDTEPRSNGIANITKGTSEWEGWGTALKPAHEPICMARKPLAEKTVAENCLKWGTGGINIDESRVGYEDKSEIDLINKRSGKATNGSIYGDYQEGFKGYADNKGRFPANLILENCPEVKACFPETKSGGGDRNGKQKGEFLNGVGDTGVERPFEANSGNASRYFKNIDITEEDIYYDRLIYQAKASKAERNAGCEGLEEKEKKTLGSFGDQSEFDCPDGANRVGNKGTSINKNNHPTVKPIALMQYLVKLVTPPGGIVLDPFAGSGTTACAAVKMGFRFIAIEKEAEYIPIIEARVKHWNKMFEQHQAQLLIYI